MIKDLKNTIFEQFLTISHFYLRKRYIIINLSNVERVVIYMKSKSANVVKKVLDVILRNEVVTVSSPIMYQEKAPDNLYERVVEREKRENH